MSLTNYDDPGFSAGVRLRRLVSCMTTMRKFILFPGCVALCLSLSAAADDWAVPEPVSFHSRGFGYVAEIFPPRSRQNSTEKPLCYFYEVGYPGTVWRVDAKLKWKAPLANDLMPYQAVVSMQGSVVTFNDYGAVGYKNAVVIYSPTGSLVARYQLNDFIPEGDTGKIETSESSRWWTKGAKYYFLESPGRLFVVLSWGRVVEFNLDTGRHKYGPAAEFRDLDKAVAKGNSSNEETEIWATSLRFSSITDVVEANAKQGSQHLGNSGRRKDDKWPLVFEGRLARVEVERALYERRTDEDCFMAVRVTNVTNRRVGVDLRRFWKVIYPNSQGFSKMPAPELIDEERLIQEPMSATEKKKLMKDYSGKGLAAIGPHGSITYFRGFTFGHNLRKEIDSASYEYLIIGLDGALQMTDGLTTEEVIFPMNDRGAEGARWVAIPLPAIWQTVPNNSLVVENRP